MGVIAYLLPFIIIFYPSLLVRSGSPQFVVDAIIVLAGAMAIMAAIQGWLFIRMGWIERAWALTAGGLLLWPTPMSTIAGGTMVAMLLAYAMVRRRASAAASPAGE
jgi:TRAP-type uncharacterized transport system fused permease subunit